MVVPYDGRTAAVRYNNPGAQYPSARARKYGMIGAGVIGGGHKIAQFPTEAHGAAANMDNFASSYKGMRLGDAVAKWRGGNGSLGVPAGFDPNAIVDDTFLGDRDRMTRFFGGMSQHEGRGAAGPVKPDVWGQAFDWYRAGGAPPGTATPVSGPAGGQPMWGMIKRPDEQPQAQPAAVNPVSGIGAISPEHMQTLARMGLLKGRQQPQPKNVGEALGQLGDMYVDQQNRRWAMGEMAKAAAGENAAWSQYGGGAPAASGAPGAAPPAPVAPPAGAGGMITAGRSFGSNPMALPETDQGQPAIGGGAPPVPRGMIGAGADFTGQPVQSEPMAPPPTPVGMAGGPERLMAQPAAAPAQPAGDPRLARLDAEEAQARRMVGNQYTRERGLAMLDDIRKRRYELDDPTKALQRRATELDIATKQRELDTPKDTLQKLKDDESLYAINPRTKAYERIAGGGSTKPGGFKDAKQLSDVEEGIRKEFSAHAKPYFEVRDAYTRIQQSAANPSPAGDLALIFNYMKMLDPGSVVREGEFATAQNAAGIPERVRNMWNRALSGERLGDDQRKDFVGQAGGLFERQQRQYAAVQSQYEGLAKRKGIDPANVIFDYGIPKDEGRPEPGAGKKGDRLPTAARSAPAIKSDAEYDALPPGSEYTAPDGKVRRKQ